MHLRRLWWDADSHLDKLKLATLLQVAYDAVTVYTFNRTWSFDETATLT